MGKYNKVCLEAADLLHGAAAALAREKKMSFFNSINQLKKDACLVETNASVCPQGPRPIFIITKRTLFAIVVVGAPRL